MGGIRERLIHAMSCEYWTIAYRKRRGSGCLLHEERIEGFQLLPQRRFVTQADPFLYFFEGKNWLFYEKQDLTDMKGTLWCRNLDEPREKPVRVLEEEFHLSYPQIFSYQTHLYMLPETRGAGEIRLYRCRHFPDKWEKAETLFELSAADTTLLWREEAEACPAGGKEKPGRECYLFTYTEGHLEIYLCGVDEENFSLTDRKRIYRGADSKKTRPGGGFLRVGGELLRPAQDCSDYYGRELIVNAVDGLEEGVFKEHERCRLRPEQVGIPGVNAVGIHTYNQNETYEVIDILHREISLRTLFKKIEWKLRK